MLNKSGMLLGLKLQSVGFAILGIGGLYGAITKDFKIAGFIAAVGGAVVALGALFGGGK